MSVSLQSTVTIGQHLPWVNNTFDYMEKLVGLIPEDMLDWRPTDPNGHFMFSLAELAMHAADSRIMFARQLADSDSKEGYFSATDDDTADEDGQWRFKAHNGKESILEGLRRSRAELQPWLDLPVDQLHQPTPGTQKVYDRALEMMREKGDDTSALEARGPATINRVLFAVAAHEAGHRGTLQTLLRLQGVDARGEH
jgi:uncharacterized damage-inducible protein DinB